jgi:hypothetical protein
LRVLISRGAVCTGIPPTKSAGLLNGSNVAIVVDNAVATPAARIPKFGKKLRLVPILPTDAIRLTNGNNFNRFFSSFDILSTGFATGSFRVDAASFVDGVPVPPFSKYVSIENQGGGAGGAAVLFNFELQL